MMDLHHTHTQYIHNLNMSPSSKPSSCDVIYIYCKAALPAVKNQEEIERSVRACVLSMQQQKSSDDEIYEGLNKMCNEIGFPLKFYKDTILPFEDKSGAAAVAQRKVPFEDTSVAAAVAQQKVPFEDTSGAAAAAQRKVDREASDASSQASKEFSNKLS